MDTAMATLDSYGKFRWTLLVTFCGTGDAGDAGVRVRTEAQLIFIAFAPVFRCLTFQKKGKGLQFTHQTLHRGLASHTSVHISSFHAVPHTLHLGFL